MKKYSPKIFKTKIFGEPVVVLCGIAGHKFIASNEASLFVSWRPPSMQKLLRSSYQKVESAIIPRESEVHAIRAPGFIRPEALVQYVEGMDFMVQEHLDMYWANKQKVEVYNLVQLLIMNLATRFFAGLDQDHDRVAKISKLMATMSPSMTSFPAVKLPGTEFHRAQKAADDLIKEFQVLIKEKKEAKSRGVEMHDLLSYMIFSTDSSGQFMPELEVAGKFMGMLSASFSSPAIATTFLMKYLGQRPDVYAQVRREQLAVANSKKSGEALNWDDMTKMKYSWNVALEVMRLIPPAQGTFREAKSDFTYEGYTIPKGWKIYWTVSTTNKDPEYFPSPEEFDPTRFEKAKTLPHLNIPFGSGPRMCPGREYTRLQILCFLHNVVKRFKWELINPNEKIIGWMSPTPAEGLLVRLQPHDDSA
uniref:Cytochrome P450 n=1 Tax=Fagus sylvatica TaxID=28930 RepID=A0A2N9E1A8_FAGSY